MKQTKKQTKKIYLGYWYQRTTLHLSEVYDFLKTGFSPLNLDKTKLKNFRSAIGVKNIEMQIDYFEYIQILSKNNVTVKMYEDGLVVFEKKYSSDVKKDLEFLQNYFEKVFSPAINYLFSLGAPVPKELANIKNVSPVFITIEDNSSKNIEAIFRNLGERKYYEIREGGVELFRGGHIFLIYSKEGFKNTEELIEMQIFFKEFKIQLHRYLNIHRVIWEEIAEIKERGDVRGKDLEVLRNRLESYKKTIELIEGRIDQMGTHVKTRKNIIKNLDWEDFLSEVLEFKYDTLDNSLSYIKSLWKMTRNYVDSSIRVFSEVQAESAKDSVKALTLITSIGVISGILGYLSANKLPQLTVIGTIYFIILVVATWLANSLIVLFYKSRKYEIKNIELDKKID